ncbi:Transposase [Ignavigranum ruoffiae]|uniref:Transposase n=1 Tax=Ignavigranum ruoffiae TaxID=89093 RepID=A0A1H9GAT2_9LACT|nr:transposase [Ignavigranum ruoffiae]SEQ47207.1 Transposase [Ignavigranum ruoffiae]
MYQPYRALFQSIFPNAEIIIDRFHVVQLLNRALNQIRIQLMRDIRYQRPRDYTKLKQLWKLILKRREDLDFQDYHTHRLFDGLITEQGMVDYLLNLDDKFYRAYHLTHQLIEAIQSHSHQAFEEVLQEGRKYLLPRPLRTDWNTLFDYRTEIHHSLTYTLSNGPVEGMNHKIKNIKRSDYGYRNFGHLRCRIFLSCQLFSQEEPPYRHIVYNDERADHKYNTSMNG